jgi:transposase
MIEAILERCAGIDVGKKFVVVCVMIGGAQDEPHTEIKKFGTIVRSFSVSPDGWSPKGVPMP